MSNAVCLDGVNQGVDDVVLSDDGVPLFWAVLAVEGLGHIGFGLQVTGYELRSVVE
jgi:hypothetical protein